jgi:plastocyanin
VTVPALSTRTTTIQFDKPGDYAYICHLPNHEAYGMVGTLRVVGG